ncbi:hypothetical protein JCM8202v2_002201 [Rhodotorula sphaerocarpa]
MAPAAAVQAQPGVLDSLKQAISHVENALPRTHVVTDNTYSAAEAAQGFCDSIQAAFDAKDPDGIVGHFTDDGWWRDVLTLDFDFNSIQKGEIKDHLSRYGVPALQSLKVIKPADAKLNKAANWLEAFTTYETPEGRGKGFLRLRESSPGAGDWRAFTFFTTLWEIKGHEEKLGHQRPLGAEHGLHESSDNWLDKRRKREKFEDEDPTCLIVGGGQNGLMLGARLTTLGIKTLIVEKNERIGDSWRIAYMQFPKTWPIYTPKDKLANYMEEYASQMELNVWLQSTIERDPKWDSQTKRWTVKVMREGSEPREMKVPHLIMATGFSGEPRMPSFSTEEFQGFMTHSSKHPGCHEKPEWRGKKAIVVGCCNSGHDIAADFYEHGLDTTIVQRSSTYVMSSEHGIPGLLKGVYEEDGPPTDDADIMLTSLPINVLEEFHIKATEEIAVKDKALLDDLAKAGFMHRKYPGGLFIKYFRDGGGYYIDVGCSRLIADGKVKIKQGVEIEKLTKDGILFQDGVELKADIVILATGYTSQRETVRRVIGADVADRLGQLWGADKQGEIPGVWRYSGVPHFWLMSGNLFQARCFSKHLALQIQMIELGLRTHADDPVAYKNAADPRF